MTKEEIKNKIQNIVRDLFDDDGIAITEETVASDINGWDSFTHINFLSCIENEFNITIPLTKTLSLKCIGDMIDLIYNYNAK